MAYKYDRFPPTSDEEAGVEGILGLVACKYDHFPSISNEEEEPDGALGMVTVNNSQCYSNRLENHCGQTWAHIELQDEDHLGGDIDLHIVVASAADHWLDHSGAVSSALETHPVEEKFDSDTTEVQGSPLESYSRSTLEIATEQEKHSHYMLATVMVLGGENNDLHDAEV